MVSAPGLAPSATWWEAWLPKVRLGLLSGLVAGLVAGIASRVAMRVVALDSGGEPSFTIGGSLFIVIMGGVVGAPLGVLFISVRRWLPGPSFAQGMSFGVLVALLFVSLLAPRLVGETPELISDLPEGNLLVGINVFVTPLVLYGLTLGVVVGRLEKRLISTPRYGAALGVGDFALVGLGLLGTAGLLMEIANIVTRAMQG